MTLALAEPLAPSRPQGDAESWDDELIALLALLTVGDVQAAWILWDSLAPKAYRGLLKAQAVDDAREPGIELPPIWFDVQTQRYGLARRGFITIAAILAAVDAFRTAAQEQAASSVAQVYTGGTEVEQWQNETAAWLKTVALVSVAAGVGGTGRIRGEDLSAASESLQFHLRKLNRFASQIAAGVVNAESAQRRASQYPESIVIGEYAKARQRSHETALFLSERNVLDPGADHCLPDATLPGCAELSERSWQPIGTIPSPGQRACRFMCRCFMQYRRELP